MTLPYLPIPLNCFLASFPFPPNLDLWANLASKSFSIFHLVLPLNQPSKTSTLHAWSSSPLCWFPYSGSWALLKAVTLCGVLHYKFRLSNLCWPFTSVCLSFNAIFSFLSPAFQIRTSFLKLLLSSLPSHSVAYLACFCIKKSCDHQTLSSLTVGPLWKTLKFIFNIHPQMPFLPLQGAGCLLYCSDPSSCAVDHTYRSPFISHFPSSVFSAFHLNLLLSSA